MSQEQTVDPLTQQMIKSDALIITLGQVRDDLRRHADQIDAVIKMASQMDNVTGLSDAMGGGVDASKNRLIGLMKRMYPDLENASDEEIIKRIGGRKVE